MESYTAERIDDLAANFTRQDTAPADAIADETKEVISLFKVDDFDNISKPLSIKSLVENLDNCREIAVGAVNQVLEEMLRQPQNSKTMADVHTSVPNAKNMESFYSESYDILWETSPCQIQWLLQTL